MVAGLLALWFYRGSAPETLYFCILSGGGEGGVRTPCPPFLDPPHVLTTHARLVDDLTSARKGPFPTSCNNIV